MFIYKPLATVVERISRPPGFSSVALRQHCVITKFLSITAAETVIARNANKELPGAGARDSSKIFYR